MTLATVTPTTEPLDKWPSFDGHRYINIMPGDYSTRGLLSVTSSGSPRNPVVIEGAIHGTDDSAPTIANIEFRGVQHVQLRGVRFSNASLWESSQVEIAGCATYGGSVRMIGHCAFNAVKNCLFRMTTATTSDLPAIYIGANWRWRYADKKKWVSMGSPDDDWFPCNSWFNRIEGNTILDYPDGVSPAAIGGSGWLPWRGTAAGTVIQKNVFGVTPEFLISNEWNGENCLGDNKSGGSPEHPLVYRDNLIFGQRKSRTKNICASVVNHIGATDIVYEDNIWTDCDSVAGVAFPRAENAVSNGTWDTADTNIVFRGNVFDNIRQTSDSTDAGYVGIAGTVFQQGGNVHVIDNAFIDCQKLAREHGRFVSSFFRGNRCYGLMDFAPGTGRPYSKGQWQLENQCIEQNRHTITRTVPYTDISVTHGTERT